MGSEVGELRRGWMAYPFGYSLYCPITIPGWGGYLERKLVGYAIRSNSPEYREWIEASLPNADLFTLVKIIPVSKPSGYVRTTKNGFTIGLRQPSEEYFRDDSAAGMGRLADRDAGGIEALIAKRWKATPPPIRYPDVEDIEVWQHLGRLLSAGEAAEPLLRDLQF